MSHELEHCLPKKIYVGHYEFSMFVVPTTHERLDGNDGMTYFDDCQIFICANLPLRRLFYVVNHEVCHAVNWSKGIDDGMTEEQFTTLNSDGETDIWIDNPGLINWKLKAARAIRKQRSEREQT